MGTFNLSEAAQAILNEGSKETLDGIVKQKMSQIINKFAIARNYDLLKCGKLIN